MYCQPFEQCILGRPRGPAWYPDMNLYTSESGYDDLHKTFYKLKTNSPPSPIYPFEDTVYPSLLASPLTKRQLQPSVRTTGALISHSPPGSDPGPTTRKSRLTTHTRKNAPATVLSTLQGAQTYMKPLSSETGKSSSPFYHTTKKQSDVDINSEIF